ncbi:cation:proton antiporter [Streptomyces sp. DSM 40750]|uniref:cation:proton antiporter n=1 Tax=Streptomyces sp. DSM 40750 TaxID=2801030 RepID=UPI00214C03A9|nr:cation:proton antiporter [Streptomyces sp. DSM 40750]UUU22868.1 cation:proton antiporter [Streptomyces sp. DSM 40750]
MVIAVGPVPPLGGHPLAMFLVQVALLLLVATLLGRLAARCSLPPIVGELLTGIVLGPSLLGHTLPRVSEWLFPKVPEQAHLLDAVGQIGVLLLVGITGLQMDTAMIRKRATTAVRVSLPGFAIPLGLGIAAGCLLPAALLVEGSDRTVFALFLGIAMCVSAIPVIAKTLMDLGLLHRNVGQLILISGTVDDVLGWLGLSVVTAMATSGLHAGSLIRSVGFLLLFVAGAALIGRPLVHRAMRTTVRSAEPGVTLSVAVALVIAFSATTHALGFEAVFGALAAGILIRGAGKDVLTRLAPLRTFVVAVLAPVFFATAGLRMDLTALADPAVLVTALVLLLIAIAGKFVGAFIGAWMSGLNRWEAIALGAGMNARGVVEVIVAMVGLRLGVLSTAMYTVIVLIAVVTSLMGPPILRRAVGRIELTADEELRRSELRSTLHKDDLKPVEQA